MQFELRDMFDQLQARILELESEHAEAREKQLREEIKQCSREREALLCQICGLPAHVADYGLERLDCGHPCCSPCFVKESLATCKYCSEPSSMPTYDALFSAWRAPAARQCKLCGADDVKDIQTHLRLCKPKTYDKNLILGLAARLRQRALLVREIGPSKLLVFWQEGKQHKLCVIGDGAQSYNVGFDTGGDIVWQRHVPEFPFSPIIKLDEVARFKVLTEELPSHIKDVILIPTSVEI